MKLIFALILVGAMSMASFATNVSVTTTHLAGSAGTLTYAYFESATASSGTSPSVNTALSQPSGTGTTTINRGGTVRLWSTQFSSSRTLPAGLWVVDLWALASGRSGQLTVSIYVTNSAGTVQSTVLASASTPTVATSKTQVAVTASGPSVTVPASGYVEVTLTAPSGGSAPSSFTLYWGKAQGTDFQVPITVVTA